MTFISTLNQKNIFLAIFFWFVSSSFLTAQTIDHPTINKLEVSYKESTNSPIDSINMVRSQSVITLKSDSNVAVLHFKILNRSDNSVVYHVDYAAGSGTLANSEGVVLFKKDSLLFYITSADEIRLQVYRYEITTEDSIGNITEVYSELK